MALLGRSHGCWSGSTRRARASSSSASASSRRVARSGERVIVASEWRLSRFRWRASATARGSSGCRCRCSRLALRRRAAVGRDRPRRSPRSRDDGAPVPRAGRAQAGPAERARPGARDGGAAGGARLPGAGARAADLVEERARLARGLYPLAARGWRAGSATTRERRQQHHVLERRAAQSVGPGSLAPGRLGRRGDAPWELEDLALPDNALAVSRERRLVVSLRDQVLERVNHLYFQRVRLLGELAALPGEAAAKQRELELRRGRARRAARRLERRRLLAPGSTTHPSRRGNPDENDSRTSLLRGAAGGRRTAAARGRRTAQRSPVRRQRHRQRQGLRRALGRARNLARGLDARRRERRRRRGRPDAHARRARSRATASSSSRTPTEPRPRSRTAT